MAAPIVIGSGHSRELHGYNMGGHGEGVSVGGISGPQYLAGTGIGLNCGNGLAGQHDSQLAALFRRLGDEGVIRYKCHCCLHKSSARCAECHGIWFQSTGQNHYPH